MKIQIKLLDEAEQVITTLEEDVTKGLDLVRFVEKLLPGLKGTIDQHIAPVQAEDTQAGQAADAVIEGIKDIAGDGYHAS